MAAFYPSTLHLQIKEAFDCFFPTQSNASHLLAKLLEYNYITDGRHIYYAGNIGIPMGLTIAPQLARLTTAFLLRQFKLPSPKDTLTLYYDDVAASFPPTDDNISNLQVALAPYKLVATENNLTQDCKYDPVSKTFTPVVQPFRSPDLIHPNSYHPHPQMITRLMSVP